MRACILILPLLLFGCGDANIKVTTETKDPDSELPAKETNEETPTDPEPVVQEADPVPPIELTRLVLDAEGKTIGEWDGTSAVKILDHWLDVDLKQGFAAGEQTCYFKSADCTGKCYLTPGQTEAYAVLGVDTVGVTHAKEGGDVTITGKGVTRPWKSETKGEGCKASEESKSEGREVWNQTEQFKYTLPFRVEEVSNGQEG